MPATAAARRVAASPARRATASRAALKPRPKSPQARTGAAEPRRATRSAPSRASSRPRSASRARNSAPARQPRRSHVTPVAGFVPLAAARTAGAVGGIADSSLVVRLTRGRLWIGLLGTLLVGIVALNVWALSLNASSSTVAAQTDGLKRANSALQARIAGELSNEQVMAVASNLGLLFPAPLAIRSLDPSGDDAAIAAKRLARGDFTIGTVAPEVPVETAPVVTEEAVAPVAQAPAVPDPAATDPATTPAPTPVAPTATAGGVGVP